MGKAGAIAQQRSKRLDAINDNWAERHPECAAEERALRRERRRIRKDFGHKVNATPETAYHASRTRQGALARLYTAGDLSLDELARAQEIAATAERIGRDVALRTVSLETRVDVSRAGDETFFESLGWVRREVAYTRWRAALPAPGPVLAMVVEDLGVRAAAQRWRMRDARAKQLLHAAIELWGELIGAAAKEIDAADLLAAQAGLG